MFRFVGDFFESRLGLRSFWQNSMSGKRPPRGIGFLRTIGFAALTVMFLQFVSGIALAFHYVPSTDLAYDSILALEQDVPWGTEIRSLHHYGASAFVIFAVLHMLRVFYTGAYKQPREFTWLSGVGLLLIVVGFGFTGYLLPWDEKAYFATRVGTEIAGKTPYVGEQLREILNGGETVGAPTLTRFYIIHVVLLPIALLGLVGLHFFLIQRHGVAAPRCPVGDEGEPGPPYFPDHVFKEALVGVVVAGALIVMAFQLRAPLEYIAEPSETGYDPRPDWYFLGLFELLKHFKGENEVIGAFWLPNAILFLLVVLPFVDRSKARHWKQRPIVITLGTLVALACAGLTIMGALSERKPRDPVLPYKLGYTDVQRQGYLLTRRSRCTSCHVYGNIKVNEETQSSSSLRDLGQDLEAQTIVDVLADVRGQIDEDTDMPEFGHLSNEEHWAIARFLKVLPPPADNPPEEDKKEDGK